LELFDNAEKVLSLMTEMRQTAGGESRISGTVRLWVVKTIAHTWLPALIREIDRRYPNVDVDLQVGVSSMLESLLNSHDGDLAITFGRSFCDHDVDEAAALGDGCDLASRPRDHHSEFASRF
jgi:DNA-binding transcriptional LysR family regulator